MSNKSGSCVAWPFFGRAVATLAGPMLFALSPDALALEASLATGGNLIANERATRGGALFRGALSSRLDTHPDGRGALVTADVLGYADERHPLVVTGALGGYEWDYFGLQGGLNVYFSDVLRDDWRLLPALALWGRAFDHARFGVGAGRMLSFGIPMPLLYGGIDLFARGFGVRLCGGYLPGRRSDQAAGAGVEFTLPLGEVFAFLVTADAMFEDVRYNVKPRWGGSAVVQASF